MPRPPVRPLAQRAAACCALVALAACGTDPSRLAAPDAGTLTAPRFDVTPTPADVVLPGADGGAFGAAFAANNSLRTTTEFWDNPSADERPAQQIVGCNVGYFGSGTISAGCAFEAPNSFANRGGYTRFFGEGGGNDPAAFQFDGTGSYALRLEGSYTELPSEIGIFVRQANGSYTLTKLQDVSNRQVGATFTVTPALTGGRPWGFYIKNGFNPQGGGCVGADTHCSDAVGDYVGQGDTPYQQFALLLNAAGTKYLVGAEDNKLELLPDNQVGYDSDYNDYMISVTPLPRGGAGCSPGFWKNAREFNWEATGYSRTTQFGAVFDDAFPGKTLQQVLEQNGGGINALGRQTVAALLNAAAIGSGYELTTAGVIARFNGVYDEQPGQYEALKNFFEGYIDTNGRSCPLSNGRR
jgi:hypothetical protein